MKKKKKNPPPPVEQLQPQNFQNKKFLYCATHEVTFLEDQRCPHCSKRRQITDDWEPSMDSTPGYEEYPAFAGSLVSAMSSQKPPKTGVLKVIKCPIHGVPYVEGVNKCPFCEFGQ